MSRPFARMFAMLLPATLAIAAPMSAQGQEALRQPIAPTLFAGRWALDLTRMPGTYGPPPKQVVYAFQDIGGGRWRLTVDITAPDDSVRHMAVAFRPDGQAAPAEADTSEADSAAIIVPVPNVLVLNLGRNRMPGSVRTYTVSANGREMTEAAAAIDAQGAPFVRNFHYKRLP